VEFGGTGEAGTPAGQVDTAVFAVGRVALGSGSAVAVDVEPAVGAAVGVSVGPDVKVRVAVGVDGSRMGGMVTFGVGMLGHGITVQVGGTKVAGSVIFGVTVMTGMIGGVMLGHMGSPGVRVRVGRVRGV
jgi:hypothetical protein